MPTTQELLQELAIPAGIVLVLGFVVSLLTRGNSAGITLGLGAGLVQCFHVLHGTWPHLQGREADGCVTLGTAAMAVVLAVLSPAKIPAVLRWIVFLAAPAATVGFVFSALPVSSMPRDQLLRWVGFSGAAAAVLVIVIEMIGRRTGSTSVGLILGPWCAGTGALLLMCGNQKLGWLGASLAVMLLSALVAAQVAAPTLMLKGPVPLVVVAVAALLAYGFYEQDVMTRTELALLAGAPVLGLPAQFGPIGRAKPWKRELTRLALVLIPIAVAVGLAYVQFKKDSAAGPDM